MIQHVVPGVPLIYYGDEVGVLDTPQYGGRAPMPWLHRSQEKAASKNFRMDFAALTQFLHIHRELHEPLRRGEFRNVMADDKRGLLAFGRTYDGKELILLINFGNAKEEVHLRVGVPGQMITVIGPRLVPMTPSRGQWVEPLRAGASRRVVKSDGTIRFWINPNAVRLILVEP